MVAKLVLDEISSSGSNITIDATKTFTVNGSLLSAGSTNILHKTGDYPIVEADVSGKSELIITTTTATPRDITLPLVGVTGAATCIITVVASDDATGTNSVRVMNGLNEAWTGYQKGDFVKFCVSDGAWVVLDHKETYYSRRYLTADFAIAASAGTKVTGWTSVSEIGNLWDNINNKIVIPTDMSGWMDVTFNSSNAQNYSGLSPFLYLDGANLARFEYTAGVTDGHQSQSTITGRWPVTTAQYLEFYAKNVDSNTSFNLYGGDAARTTFIVTFTRTY